MDIPLIDLKSEYMELREEVLDSIDLALQSMQLFLGPNVQQFEKNWADFCGVSNAIGLSNGTESLHLALRALGIGPGDEVITVAWTFFASIEAIVHAGATPRIVDIDPDYYTMDPSALEAAITDKTRAVIPVHIYGQPADMDAIKAICEPRDIKIVEDSCQAHGAKYKGQVAGSLGDAGTFSFYMSKNLAGYGEGGMATTRHDDVAANIRMLRDHGQRERGTYSDIGYNARLDEIQAAILNVKFPRLAGYNTARRAHAALYDSLLADVGDVETPKVAESTEHIYHLYTIRSDHRDTIGDALKDAGIGFAKHYASPPHKSPAAAKYGLDEVALPVTERLAGKVISLPMYPGLSDDQIGRVVEVVKSVFS